MTMKGFFRGGYNLREAASSPLGFTTDLNFTAFETDPAWWDIEKIKASYKTFYQNQTDRLGDIPKVELVPDISTEFNKIPKATLDEASKKLDTLPKFRTLLESDDLLLTPGVVDNTPSRLVRQTQENLEGKGPDIGV